MEEISRPTLVILAAGHAARFGRSKQIEAVGPSGEAIMDYSIFDALQSGFGAVVVVVGSDFPDELRRRFAKRWENRVAVHFADQQSHGISLSGIRYSRTRLWGTGHALLAALPKIHAGFAVINADDYYGTESYRLLQAFLTGPDSDPRCDACMVGFPLEQTLSAHGGVSRGICHSAGGFLEQVCEYKSIIRDGGSICGLDSCGELKALSGCELASMNMWGFRSIPSESFTALFDDFIQASGNDPDREFYLPDAVNGLIARGCLRVRTIATTERWFGLTYAGDLQNVRNCIAQKVSDGYYPRNCFQP